MHDSICIVLPLWQLLLPATDVSMACTPCSWRHPAALPSLAAFYRERIGRWIQQGLHNGGYARYGGCRTDSACSVPVAISFKQNLLPVPGGLQPALYSQIVTRLHCGRAIIKSC